MDWQLRCKALLALEEAAQACRYAPVRQTHALRFALAYLWSIGRGDRQPYDAFWRAMTSDAAWRYGIAERALIDICAQVGCRRDEEAVMRLWRLHHAEHLECGRDRPRSGQSGLPPRANAGSEQGKTKLASETQP